METGYRGLQQVHKHLAYRVNYQRNLDQNIIIIFCPHNYNLFNQCLSLGLAVYEATRLYLARIWSS